MFCMRAPSVSRPTEEVEQLSMGPWCERLGYPGAAELLGLVKRKGTGLQPSTDKYRPWYCCWLPGPWSHRERQVLRAGQNPLDAQVAPHLTMSVDKAGEAVYRWLEKLWQLLSLVVSKGIYT